MSKKLGFIERTLTTIFGDGAKPETPLAREGVAMLSHWLPHRSYEPETDIYYNASSIGFIVEAAPMVGANERTGDLWTQFLSNSIPPGCELQFLYFQSPSAGPKIADWILPRLLARGVFGRAAEHRARWLRRGAWESLSKDSPFFLRQHRLFISISAAVDSNVDARVLASVRDGLNETLDAVGMPARKVTPVELIGLLDELLSPSVDNADKASHYSRVDPIAGQCIRRDLKTVISEDRIVTHSERFRPTGEEIDGAPVIGEITPDKFDLRFFSVRNFPAKFAPWDAQLLIGDPFNDKLRHRGNLIIGMTLVFPSEEGEASKAGMQMMRKTSLAGTQSAKYLPQLAEQSIEWQHVIERLRQGEKLTQCYYCVGMFAPYGTGDSCEKSVKSVFKSAGWDLHDERYLQVEGLLSMIPLTSAGGLSSDLKRFQRFKRILTSTAASIAPIQGEFNGGDIPHLLLVSRRGQPFFWSPFENGSGNHNVAVFGKSGSGKSVMIQELCSALVGAGAKAIVVDNGRSFEHMARALGGNFVEFKLSSGFSLNPFDMIEEHFLSDDNPEAADYLVDCLAMLKSIVGQMARQEQCLSDNERGLIDEAVNLVWSEHGRKGTIDMVVDAFSAMDNHSAQDLSRSMTPFSTRGTFGHFFTGPCSIDLSADITVFELEDLTSKPELRSVCLAALMFRSLQMMRKIDRSIRKALVIDEAWELLGGGQMGKAIETYARTCRKYGGSLITATQSINDFYKSEGSIAALENSDWFIVLSQKEETINDLGKNQRFGMDPFVEKQIRSLKTTRYYSELLVKGPDTVALGRLVLDPYSVTLYSSKPEVFAAIQLQISRGYEIGDAIDRVAFAEHYAELDHKAVLQSKDVNQKEPFLDYLEAAE
jgi:conjugal transfer ATP-binding protein TraC